MASRSQGVGWFESFDGLLMKEEALAHRKEKEEKAKKGFKEKG